MASCKSFRLSVRNMHIKVIIYFIVLLSEACSSFNIPNDFIPVINTIDFLFTNFTSENDVCKNHIQQFVENFNNDTLWAYKFWDASAKVPNGIMEGNQYQLGNYDECISINIPFETQYCLAAIKIDINFDKQNRDVFSAKYKPYSLLYENLNTVKAPNRIPRNQIYWALCLPASCNAEAIKNELEQYLNKESKPFISRYNVVLQDSDCQTSQSGRNYTIGDYLFCMLVITTIIIVTACTIYHIKYINTNNSNSKKKFDKYVLCFSMKENMKDLTKEEEEDKHLRILYGTRVIVMAALIYTHSIAYSLTQSIFNLIYYEQLYGNALVFMMFCRLDLTVDFFLVVGGLLNTYHYLKQSEKNEITPLRQIILRYFRLIPVFLVMSFFYATLLYKMGSGSLWAKVIGTERAYCENNWWTNLLLINNYVNIDNMCMLQGWYLAADFQLYLLSIPINKLMKGTDKFPKTMLFLLFGTITIPFSLVYFAGKQPFFSLYYEFFFTVRKDDSFQSIYTPVYTRIGPYIVGMILGFIYYKLRKTDLKISLASSIQLMLLSTIIGSVCFFTGIVFYNPREPDISFIKALYLSLHRPAFGVSVGICLFVFSFGTFPITLLKSYPMIPLSKLTFSAYIVHMAVQLILAGVQRTPSTESIPIRVCYFLFELFISFILAVVLFLVIENPCSKFIKTILPSKVKTATNSKDESEKKNM